MKAILFSVLILLYYKGNCQTLDDSFIVKRFRQIIKLVESDNATDLSKIIAYPLKRRNPLPDIKSPDDFISNYKILFDSSLKNLLSQYNDSDIFEHHDSYGLVGGNFSGELWLNEDGKISGLVSSKTEQQKKQVLVTNIKRLMNPVVNNWNENIIVGKSGKLLIRVDRTDRGLRYVCWSNGKSIKDSPDIVLYNGIEDAQGTMGGWTWTFKNDDWTYVIHDAELCEEEEDCGLFLEVSFKEELKSKAKLAEIK